MNQYRGRLLIVDDSPEVLALFRAGLTKANFVVDVCLSLDGMKKKLGQFSYDAILLDLNLDREKGLDGFPYILKTAPWTKLIILTSSDSLDHAIECMGKGASWYFTKSTPLADIATRLAVLLEEDRRVYARKEHGSQPAWREKIVGVSAAIEATCAMIDQVKDVDSTVLLLGESGTGKEVVARAIHQASDRRNNRYEAVNCGAIPEALLESELFGHRKGAFTDAKSDKRGIFEVCSRGTLLLDEIGDMPVLLQTKILRVMQERQVMPIGSQKSIDIQTRVIAATHRELADEVQSGRFREDLYYRLSVVVIEIPPLRQRTEDIPLLIEYFLNNFNKRFDRTVKLPSVKTMNKLKHYNWPGNVRELQNAIERGVVFAKSDELTEENMFSNFHCGTAVGSESKQRLNDDDFFYMTLTDAKHKFAKRYIESVLEQTHGNIAELARRSGRHRADLYRIIERYGIEVSQYRN